MKRTHDGALKWRPPGRPLSEQLGIKSKEGGRYMADGRQPPGGKAIPEGRRSEQAAQPGAPHDNTAALPSGARHPACQVARQLVQRQPLRAAVGR
eukprot:1635403-Prymnesium_polylepis.1